MIKHYNIICRC